MKRLAALVLIVFCLTGSAFAAANFAPITAREGKYQALDCLKYCGFGAEYNSVSDALTRWEDDINIYVTGSPTQSDLQMLDDFIMQLSFRVQFLPPIARVSQESQANIVIYYGPLNTLPEHVSEYVEGNWGMFTYYMRSNVRYKAEIGIASDVTSQQQRNHLMMEELVGALAMANDHDLYSDSIVYQPWTEVQQLSEIDWLMINMIYHPDLRVGMSYAEVYDALVLTI